MRRTEGAAILKRYLAIRRFTERLCEPLSPEDCALQSMPDASPTRWHLAHTTWFFETFVLAKLAQFQPFDASFAYLFNSYYNSLGPQYPRHQRGLLSRPALEEIWQYRRHVDERMTGFLEADGLPHELLPVVELGLQHEQQHQELVLTDIKHLLSCNPLYPAYRKAKRPAERTESREQWCAFVEGVHWIGHMDQEFAFDNESPCHRVFLQDFELACQPVTNGEYRKFMADGGYRRPELWLSLGWQAVCSEGWQSPLYWVHNNGGWSQFTLAGLRRVRDDEPVCHVSYFEADAFARWAGARLPTEAEWEVAAASVELDGNFADTLLRAKHAIHPGAPVRHGDGLERMFGDVWEWTASPYTPYPGYTAPVGALGEYNGKFMCNQYVLRGGSCASSLAHLRSTYRNFFPPEARWQFSGIRLAR